MSTIEHLLTDLGGRDISLRRNGDRLLVNAPKGAMTKELSARIRDNKAAILEFLAGGSEDQDTIPKAPPGSAPMLSFAQQRMWFLDQLECDEHGVGGAHYNIPQRLRLTGELNHAALEQAITAITARHEPLRSLFPSDGGDPQLVIADELPIRIPITDLSGEPDPLAAAKDRVFKDASTGFNLSTGPLFRCHLLRLSENDHVFLANMHHIISDGWSTGILVRELAMLYPYFSQTNGKQSQPLAPLEIQYSDFSHWQHQRLAGGVKDKQIAYWQETLADIPSLHQIPTDRPRPRVMTYRGASYSERLDATLSQDLKQLAQKSGVSLFMLLEAGFATLLHRYSGQQDIVIGTPIANRHHQQLEPLIGLFVNTLVMRNDFSDDPTFTTFLHRVRTAALQAYDHQDIPFEQILEVLDPERNLSYSPVFQVMFSLVNTPTGQLKLPGLELSGFDLGLETAKFDLNLSMVEAGDGLAATMEYSSDLFDRSTIEKMLAHFQQLLQSIVDHPDRRISRLELLTIAERSQLLDTWNQTQLDYPQDQCIHQLFEAQVARTPDALAVADVDPDKTFTYAQLNAWADQIATVLRSKGVGPWVRVGLMVERSAEMIAGIYGILKAGGAYVPIDPTYPAERIAFILEDCSASVLLTKRQWCGNLPDQGTTVICLDEPLPEAENPSSVPAVEGDHLIYIIYTSGSTGQPKGAGVYHRGFVNMVHWFIKDFELGAHDRVLLTSSVSFDLTQKNMYAPLLVGGSLHLAPPSPYDPQTLVNMVNDRHITWLNCTPSAFYPLIEDSGPQWETRLDSLRWVFLGGEPISIARLNPWLTQPACHAVVVNTYGPTECTDISNFWPMPEPQRYLNRPTPIGKAIYNVQLLVLDGQLGLLPPGSLGELCIFGDSVGPGYLNDAPLTAQKFVPNPFATAPGDRLYRTGDRVRHLPAGEIEFNGRIDHQIKIRGFRVELGEIEAALIKHEPVREAVVLIKEHAQEKHIAAYLLLEDGFEDQGDFGNFLADKLPDYMIPSFFICLDELPMTPSGKIDRKALDQLALPKQTDQATFTAAEGDAEEALAAIFASVLGIEEVSVTTSFFRLGGHSLLATKIMSRIREQFEVNLPLQTLFEAPTVRGLAKVLDQAEKNTELPMVAVPRDGYLPLSYSQTRLWFLYQLEGAVATYNMPLAFRVKGNLKLSILEWAYTQVVARHENLRTTFSMDTEQPSLLIHPATTQTIATHDLSHLEEGERETFAESFKHEHGLTTFELDKGPLHRLSCLKLGPEDHMLLLNMHHIISDGWSESLFMQEIITFYSAFEQGEPSPFPELTIQYADYAHWQRKSFDGDGLDEQIAYWQQQLGDGPKPLSLPTDAVRPAVRTFSGDGVNALVDSQLGKELQSLTAGQDATMFMTLLAVFYHLLARHSGMDDITVGTPIAGRSRGETEPLIGMFLNTLVLRADLSGDTLTFAELLARVRKLTLDAYANQDVPFEKLLEVINPERDMSRTPLFQVFFNMLNMPRVEDNPISDLQFQQLGNPEIGSKFDLTLYVAEIPNGAIRLQLHYNADLFEKTRMQHLLNQYTLLLERIVQDPAKPLQHHSLITAERESQLPIPTKPLDTTWQGPVFAKLAIFAREIPEKLAVKGLNQSLSYQDLEQRSNALAQALMDRGIQKSDRVVIYAARCPALVVAILGTLKAGATITMLDPAYPTDRLVYYCDAVQPAAVIALSEAGTLPEALKISLQLTLDPAGKSSDFAAEASSLPAVELGPDDPACITFTSGSTGNPKGIVGRHGSLTHFMPWLTQTFNFKEDDRFSMLSGLAHDPLQRDIFTPLWLGATICVPDPDVIGPGLLFDWMKRENISIAHLTPAMARIVIERQDSSMLEAFRLAFVTGDVLTSRDVARLRTIASDIDVVNFYGTTETQRAVGYSKASDQSADWQREAMPLGRGMPGVQLLIINPAGKLAAMGEMGEIHVRSPHLALGYLNRPELTQERFIANPFDPSENHSVYRTGDLGYYLPDGRVAFAGRADHQVQIRGYRIEIPEIEGVLAAHPRVEEAAVLHFEPADSDPFLVAYLQSEHHAAADLGLEARRSLQEQLPSFMVPTHFLAMQALPLTPNGKLDRAALKRMSLPKAASVASGEGASTPTEAVLAAIWQEVLGIDQVPIDANFFDLGGHSLSATRVITRMRDALGVLLPLRSLFEAPTVRTLALKLEAAKRETRHEPPLVQQLREAPIPLSFAQERLWFLDRLEGAHAAYNMPFALKLEGPLDQEALAKSLTAICERHEILRVAFQEDEGQALMQFREPEPFELPIAEITEAEIEDCVAREAGLPFDLENDVLFRAKLLRLGDERHLLLLTLHHIIADGWSLGILSNELAVYYQGFLQTSGPQLSELPIQYGDFALWQRQWLKDEVLEEQLGFWKNQLQGAPTLLELPTDRPRPKSQTFNGARLPFVLDAPLAQGLSELASKEGATLFMVLEAAFSLLLSRYSDTEDILIGTPVANRTRSETERLIGLFVNTLIIRNDLSDNPSFQTFLQRVRQAALDAYAHQDVPFEKVIDAVSPERNLGFSPLFQVMLVFQNLPSGEQVAHDLAISRVNSKHVNAKFDLTLTMNEAGDRIVGNFEYNTDLFDRATIEQKCEHFRTLLHAIVEQPEKNLAELSLFEGDQDNQEILSAPLEPFEKCVHHLFEEQVARTPGATAFIGKDGKPWTYEQLNHRANGLAEVLTQHGVAPCDLVGVLMPRCPDMIASMLAIHKCGAAYVPLDPAYPAERIRYMREDAGLSALLTFSPGETSDTPEICVQNYPNVSDQNPQVPILGDQLSYVIYTSGSTGKPKGVAVPHRAVTALIRWSQNTFDDFQFSGVLASTSICFDISVFEIFAPLTTGGTIILTENVLALTDHPAKDRVRLINTVPSAMAELQHNNVIPASVHTMTLCGEALRGELVQKLYASTQVKRIYNLYGPSEDTTFSTDALICRTAKGEPPIGKPLMGTSALVLGPHLQTLPPKAPGMLYLAGEGQARGYLGKPAKTAEAFIPHPFANGKRIYRTGDRVSLRGDGDLFFLGRNDHQVKLRGFRIELGEIEAALNIDPEVSAAHVQVIDKQLVAFLQTNHRDLRQHLETALKDRLPAHMIPTRWLFLEQFPVLPNGKTNRKALTIAATEQTNQTKAECVAPETEAEINLHQVWQAVLPGRRFGVTDNFFHIGGDSILSLRIIARARQFGLHFNAKDLFQFPTIRQLAKAANQAPAVVIDAEQGQVSGQVPLTPVQHWFLDQDWRVPGHFNQSLMFSLSKGADLDRLQAALEAVVHHHDALRLRFHKQDDQWRQTHGENHALGFQVIDLQGHDQPKMALEQQAQKLQAACDLGKGPLFRAVVFKGCPEVVPGNSMRLLLIVHHLVIDGISWRILLEDLGQAYAYPQMSLPEKTSSFKAWSHRLMELEINEKDLAWWRDIVALKAAPIPKDFPETAGVNSHALAKTFQNSLDQPQTEALLGKVHKAYRTNMDDVLLTALMETVHQCFGQTSLMVDLEGHGREDLFEDLDLSRTVGWFTSVYPLRLEKGRDSDPIGTLKNIKEIRRAIPDKGIGFGVAHYLQGEWEHQAPADILFNYLGQTGETGAGHDLFGPASEGVGDRRSPEDLRSNLLELNAIVVNGKLSMTWTYASAYFEQETMRLLAETYAEKLAEIIAVCTEEGAGGYTPSDFPLTTLPQEKLDDLLESQGRVVDIYPLSPMQEGMLFHALAQPDSGNYFEQSILDIEGSFVPEAFINAWQLAIERFAILRTSFYWKGLERPLQCVLESQAPPVQIIDFRHISAEELPTALTHLQEEERRKGFQLDALPLMRILLVRCTDERWQIIWNFHHILLDGWSAALLFREVMTGYVMAGQSHKPDLPAIHPYREYIAWLETRSPVENAQFWRHSLNGFSKATPLPYSQQVDPAEPRLVETAEVFLEEPLQERLDAFAIDCGVTNFTLVQAAWAIILGIHSQQEDVLFGNIVSGRPAELDGIESMIGLFINALPARVHLTQQPIKAWLQDLQSQNIARENVSYTPLVEAQSYSWVPRSEPLFESLLVFENYPAPGSDGQTGDTSLKILKAKQVEQSHLPLALLAIPGRRLRLKLSFETPRFNRSDMVKILEQLAHILEKMSADAMATPASFLHSGHTAEAPSQLDLELEPSQKIAPPVEPQGFVGPVFHMPNELPVHGHFEKHAAEHPDHPALVWDGGDIVTYGELNQRANQLAWRMVDLGVKPDDRVGILAQSSPELFVGFLAILKAGAAILPLDRRAPAPRLIHMVNDSQISLALIQGSRPDQFPDIPVIDLDETLWSDQATENPAIRVFPDQGSYLIYTSGSTGLPKASLNTHHGIINHFLWIQEIEPMKPHDRMLYKTPISFDAAIWESFLPLMVGAQIVFGRPGIEGDPGELRRIIAEYGVTHAVFVPSMFRALLDELGEEILDCQFRLLISGGEALLPQDQERAVSLIKSPEGPLRIRNHYGPSEAAISCISYPCKQTPHRETIPIGKPEGNMQAYAVDPDFHPTREGVTGELVIAGPNLSRGYFGRPALTAEKFVPNPFSTEELGSRLYRTGDLVSIHQDLGFYFMNRIDHQIKIRGFRVEPGEIEILLANHPLVQTAVVNVREREDHHEKFLVAHILPVNPQETDPDLEKTLRNYTRESLPEHMVPGYFDLIDAMPVTSNGKLDRKALDRRPLMLSGDPSKVDPPRNLAETRMVALWEKVLDRQPIGIHDNFFDLGGHSLTAVRLLAQCLEEFERPLQLPELFTHPTPAQLATLLEAESEVVAHPVALQPKGDKTPIFLVHPAGGSVSCYQPIAELVGGDRPIYGIHADFSQPEDDLVTMAKTYLGLVKKIVPHGPYILGGWSMGGTVAFEMVRQLQALGEPAARLILIDSIPSESMALNDNFGDADVMADYVNQIAQGAPGFAIDAEDLRALSESERIAEVMRQAKEAGIVAAAAEWEQLKGNWNVFRANAMASLHYQPGEFNGTIHLLRAEEQDPRFPKLHDNGWGDLATEVITLIQPGDHMTMVAEPRVRTLVQTLETLLEDLP